MPAASNGMDAKPATGMVTTAFTALESAQSVRMYGSFSVPGGGARYKLDITLGPAGMRGSMTMPIPGAKIATVQVVLTHGRMYVRSASFWRQFDRGRLAPLIGGRWVILPSGSSFPLRNAKTFIKTLNRAMKPLRNAHVARVKTTVNGQPAVELHEHGAAAYFATTGHPYLLEIRQGSHNKLDFQYSGTPVTFAAPPHAIDLSHMAG